MTSAGSPGNIHLDHLGISPASTLQIGSGVANPSLCGVSRGERRVQGAIQHRYPLICPTSFHPRTSSFGWLADLADELTTTTYTRPYGGKTSVSQPPRTVEAQKFIIGSFNFQPRFLAGRRSRSHKGGSRERFYVFFVHKLVT